MHVAYEYGPRGDMPPVRLTWYQGEEKPEPWRSGAIPKWDSGVLFVGAKGMLAVRLRQAPAPARGGLPRLQAARAVHPQVDRPPRRVDPRLQDRRADDLQLRVRRLADRGQPPGQRRLPRRQEARMGRRDAPRHQRPRGRPLPPPRVPQGVVARLKATESPISVVLASQADTR